MPCAREGRAGLYLTLWKRLRVLDHDEREKHLEALAAWAGLDRLPRQSHRPLRSDEVVELGRGRMSIGAHTQTHPVLSALPAERQAEEIGDSKAALEALLGRPVQAFSYPYGALGPGTAEAVRRAGFAYACATGAGAVRRAADPYLLPRVVVEDWDGATFARRLAMPG